MKGLLRFIGRGAGSLGRFLGFGGAMTYLLQGYTQFRLFSGLGGLFNNAKALMGVHFHQFVEANPFVNFFFVAGIIVFTTALFISFFYRIFGLKMSKKVQTYILASPFLVVFCAIIYIGYVHNLRLQDPVYTNFSNANTEGEVATIKQQKGYSHIAQKSYEKDYIFNCIGKNLSEAFYVDMCRELSYDELNARCFKLIKVKGYEKRQYKMNITPLMYAAYIGNKEAVAALLNSNKVDIRAVSVTRDRVNCPDGFGWFLNKKYTYKVTHTPYSIAYDNGHAVRYLIKKYSQDKGYNDYAGLFTNYKLNDCSRLI